jgi:hypothetical protein
VNGPQSRDDVLGRPGVNAGAKTATRGRPVNGPLVHAAAAEPQHPPGNRIWQSHLGIASLIDWGCHQALLATGPFTALYRAAVLAPAFMPGRADAQRGLVRPVYGPSRYGGLSLPAFTACLG